MTQNVLTFDIEDNFTLEELSDPADWQRYERQVVSNTDRILELLAAHGVRATFFVVGKVAERRPEVVRRIVEGGHEVASHGYRHERIPKRGSERFDEDLRRSREVLESVSGRPVRGYRAMGFSLRPEMAWAVDCLQRQGFTYDSSIAHSELLGPAERYPSPLFTGGFHEVPLSSIGVLGRHLKTGGGIFFRTAPLAVVRAVIRAENRAGRPAVLYAHAWEFNRDQPSRRVRPLQALAQSPRLFTTPSRLDRLLAEFPFTSCADFLDGTRV